MFDFVSLTAYAQEATSNAAKAAPSTFELLAMPLGFLVIMYFFMIRPQQKKAKDQANLLTQLKAGDEVVTSAGIIGRIRSVSDSFVTLEVAQNTAIKVLKNTITALTKDHLKPLSEKK